MEKLIDKAMNAKRESKYVEFKSQFDLSSRRDWCEVIKDIIAITNSSGGIIVFGLDNSGNPTKYNPDELLQIDPADITNKIAKYIGTQFSDFELSESKKNGKKVALLVIDSSPLPLVFRKPGTYDIGGGKQNTAFKEGSVYFRHGAKSAPGDTDDLRRSFQRQLDSVKKSWLTGIKKVVQAPRDSEIMVLTKDVRETTNGSGTPIRLSSDPNAPAYRKIDPDITHPYRQKELTKEVKKRLPKNVRFNSYDVLSIWHAHDIVQHTQFFHSPKFATTQYSEAYVSWIVDRYTADNQFFEKARSKYYEIKHSRR